MVPCTGHMHFFLQYNAILCTNKLHLIHLHAKRFKYHQCRNSILIEKREFLYNHMRPEMYKTEYKDTFFFNQSPKILYLQFSIVGSIGNFS